MALSIFKENIHLFSLMANENNDDENTVRANQLMGVVSPVPENFRSLFDKTRSSDLVIPDPAYTSR